MPKIKYEDKNFHSDTLDMIHMANSIIEEYENQGFKLTLRQIYYQFVTQELIRNNEKNYKRLGDIISDGRRAGLINWESIEDRNRYLRQRTKWETPKSIIEAARDSYHIDLWEDQDVRLEVWIEKDALVGVIQGICNQYDVPFFSCHGYVSDTAMWEAAMRQVKNYSEYVQDTVIIHLGDHDPSGIDMTRDIRDRIKLFTAGNVLVEVKRIALSREQVLELDLPANPAKITDSRFNDYVKNYGSSSWELDALKPQYMVNLIEHEILKYLDVENWNSKVEKENIERSKIAELLNNL
jgi:hypothetical protein